jgi:hypothetical protein
MDLPWSDILVMFLGVLAAMVKLDLGIVKTVLNRLPVIFAVVEAVAY